MSEVRNLERRNKVFMVYELDERCKNPNPVQKLVVLSEAYSETDDDFMRAVRDLSSLNKHTGGTWTKADQYVYDEVTYNAYETEIHPLSVESDRIKLFVTSRTTNRPVSFSVIFTKSCEGTLIINGTDLDILHGEFMPWDNLYDKTFFYQYICKYNENSKVRNSYITRSLICRIPRRYIAIAQCERIQNTSISNNVASGGTSNKSVEIKTFKTAIQDQRLLADDYEIAEWIGDRELVSISSVVSDNKLIRTVVVKK